MVKKMAKSKTTKIVLDLKGGRRKRVHTPVPGSSCCRNHMVVVPGTGDKNFKFPSVETLVIRALNRLKTQTSAGKPDSVQDGDAHDHEHDCQGGTCSHPKEGADSGGAVTFKVKGSRRKSARRFRIVVENTFIPGIPTHGQVPATLIPQLPAERRRGDVDATLFAAAEGLRLIMEEGRFDAIVADRFDPLAGAVNWARHHMSDKYQGAIESLGVQLNQLQSLYKDALPRVLTVLAAQNPKVPGEVLLEAAVDTLDQELAQIITVLRIWTDAFAQLRDGMYKQLEAITFLVEQAFVLFEGGSLDASCDKDCLSKLKTTVFKVGNVFVARFSDNGPATLPARGPIGAHAIEVPMDERNIITLMLALYAHEFRHDIFHDVEGLEDELRDAVAAAIARAHKGGEFKFSSDTVTFRGQKIKTIDMLVKLFADTIGEVDADISGGVLLTGPAFLYNMILSFSAFNARRRGVENTPHLLRSGSYYEVSKDEESGDTTLDFLPHPPDYIRAYIVAAALDEIGFVKEADQCRALADQAVRVVPEFITWGDVEGKSKSVIKLSAADIKQVAPVVARALIRTPLKSLGGLTTEQVINWNSHRQEKVDRLAHILMEGKSELPGDIGDVYATYVAAAATLAYWALVKGGYAAKLEAAPNIEKNALAMLDALRVRMNAQPVSVDEHRDCKAREVPEVSGDGTAPAGTVTTSGEGEGNKS